MSTRPIFRPSAVEAYRRGLDRANVPRLMDWPSMAFFWALLAILLVSTIVAWSVHIPTYAAGSGVILARSGQVSTTAVLFLAPDQSTRLRRGRRVHLNLGSAKSVDGVISRVIPGMIGPNAARQRYGAAGLITQPSVVVAIRLSRALPSRVYGGSRVTARVEVASERIVSLLTG